MQLVALQKFTLKAFHLKNIAKKILQPKQGTTNY